MADEPDDIAILICGTVQRDFSQPVEEAPCADCGTTVIFARDPEVPEDAVKLCFPCAKLRIEESGEAPTFVMTKRNEEAVKRRGYTLDYEGSC